jgi:hypothetical protein
MCQDLIHRCKYCNKDYHCDLEDFLCPTINYDTDQNMCKECRGRLEAKLEDDETFTIEKLVEDIEDDNT